MAERKLLSTQNDNLKTKTAADSKWPLWFCKQQSKSKKINPFKRD